MRRPRLGLVLGHLPTYLADAETFADTVAVFRDACARLGADVFVVDGPVLDAATATTAALALEAEDVDAVVLGHVTFTMGEVTDTLVGRGHRTVHWSLAEPRLRGDIPLNGFVSAHLGVGLEHRRTRQAPFWLHGSGQDEWFAGRLAMVIASVSVEAVLRRTSVGLVGGIAPGFETFAVDAAVLAAELGVRVVDHPLAEAIGLGEQASIAEVEATATAMRAAVRRGTHVADEDLDANARLSLGLASLAAEHGHTALAVSDWPELQERLDVHPGAALTWLEERGMVASCEGDVLGAVTMTVLRVLSGAGAALLDIATVDPPSGTALLWHCGGSPLSLSDDEGAAWTRHSTLGRNVPGARQAGVVADLRFAPGPVTIARIDRDGRRLTVAEAAVVPGPDIGFDGTRGWIGDITIDGASVTLLDFVEHVVGRAVDHHVALTPGHHGRSLLAWARWAGIDTG